MNPQVKIATSKAFYPPPNNVRKVNADSFLANGGDIFGKYVWTMQGGLLGMAYEANIENDGSYQIVFGQMYDVASKMKINSSNVMIGVY